MPENFEADYSTVPEEHQQRYWYYYDGNTERQGPFHDGQLKWLVKQGVILPDTLVESNTGHAKPAKTVKGLVFDEKPVIVSRSLPKNSVIYATMLGLIMLLLTFSGVWWILIFGWLFFGFVCVLLFIPSISIDTFLRKM